MVGRSWRRSRTDRCPQPSSIPRSPEMPGSPCWRTGFGRSEPTALHPHVWIHSRQPMADQPEDAPMTTLPTLELLPAVDVADGQAVQLVQGVAGTGGQFGDPWQAAL